MRLKAHTRRLPVLLAIVLCAACSGHYVAPDAVVEGFVVTAWIPYVEEVVIPSPLYAGEDFTVRLRLSSALDPRLLVGDLAKDIAGGFEGACINPGLPDVALLPMFMYHNGVNGDPPQEWMDYPWPVRLPAGEWFIGVQSAKTHELGGWHVRTNMSYLTFLGLGNADPASAVEYRLYPITVVKRPGS